jgi:hypothetical protein
MLLRLVSPATLCRRLSVGVVLVVVLLLEVT